jgi:transcriptional regulator of arginine metabolism
MNKGQEYRRSQILSIIGGENVRSQEELREKLEELGIEVTQATLSRDLKALGIVRVFDGEMGYVYSLKGRGTLPSGMTVDPALSLIQHGEGPRREIVEISFSGNLAVIKTKLGHATGIAFEIDQLGIPDVIGTIGGDDTLLVVLREGADREAFIRALY